MHASGRWRREGPAASRTAGARLGDLVRDLTRARHRQLLVEVAATGLFAGLLLACVPVLAARFGGLPWPEWPLAAGLAGLAVAVAALDAWRRRPGDLEVAIRADLDLRLAQRLSTAWEFGRREPGSARSERLAALALARRMPMTHLVFPLRVGTWGRLVPVAAVLLALVHLVDPAIRAEHHPAPVDPVDPVVAEEGARLREHGRRMEARAQRESLPRSGAGAGELQRVGSRMASGAQSREQALRRLRALDDRLVRQRREALAEGLPVDLDPFRAEGPGGSPLLPGEGVGALLARLRQGALASGALAPGDLEALATEAALLSVPGIDPAQFREALQRFADGEQEALRRLIEQLEDVDVALREAALLLDAERAVALARENLGEPALLVGTRGEDDADAAGEEGVFAWLGRHFRGRPGDEADPFVAAHGPGRGEGPGSGPLRSPSPRPRSEPGEVALRLEGRPGEGPVFATGARVLPRGGRPALPVQERSPSFRPGFEAVLDEQDYPARHRELVRRYFLALSEGAPAAPPDGEGAR